MPDITLTGLTKIFGNGREASRAVDAVDLHIEDGEFFFLLGPSGCGKTTLLRMLAGLIVPSRGTIHFGEDDVTDRPVEKRDTAMVFQNYALWPHMTVQGNVEFGPRMKKRSRPDRQARVDNCLEMVQIQSLNQRKPRQLSGGQQQRVAVARALAAEPACLLLDEPLSNLDAQLRLQMRAQLRDIVKASRITAVYVTHDQKEALAMADRMAVMKDGRIVQVGTPESLYNRPVNTFVAEFIGEANFIQGIFRDQAVETPAGRIPIAGSNNPGDGEAVVCCIRPERLSLSAAGQPGLPATVTHRVYQGETSQYRVCLASGESWKILIFGGREAFSPGDRVAVGVSAESASLIHS